MESLTLIQWITYLSLIFALIMLLYRTVRIAKLPIHLRWELYPVPHEKGKAYYGGSYMEEFEWWTKERQVSKADEIKEMAEEIIFIKSLFKKNRGLWILSFPFHFGLYLLIGFAVLLIISALLKIFNGNMDSGFSAIINILTQMSGVAGIILTLIGSAGLLLKRLFDYNLRCFSGFADYFNLVIFVIICGNMLVAWVGLDYNFNVLRDYTASLMTASPFVTSGAVTIEIIAVLFFLVYLPFTHMTHFIAKYFTYHHVRWSDEPNIKNSKIEKQVDRVLQYPVSWSAPHIKGDGKKSWVDVATKKEDDENGK
jgi:nitrate reductase gamma subunit